MVHCHYFDKFCVFVCTGCDANSAFLPFLQMILNGSFFFVDLCCLLKSYSGSFRWIIPFASPRSSSSLWSLFDRLRRAFPVTTAHRSTAAAWFRSFPRCVLLKAPWQASGGAGKIPPNTSDGHSGRWWLFFRRTGRECDTIDSPGCIGCLSAVV